MQNIQKNLDITTAFVPWDSAVRKIKEIMDTRYNRLIEAFFKQK